MRKILIESETKEFISRLPELSVNPPTAHLIMMGVRSRKAMNFLGVKMKDVVVERRVIRDVKNVNWRDRMFDKIFNLAVLQTHGRYNVKDTYTVPEVVGIYSLVAPRDVSMATFDSIQDVIKDVFVRDDVSCRNMANQYTKFASNLHKHQASSYNYFTVDIDEGGREILRQVLDIVSPIPKFMVTETSRGYHVVLDLSKREDALTFHYNRDGNAIKKQLQSLLKTGIDLLKQAQEPIPGTLYCREGGETHYVRILE